MEELAPLEELVPPEGLGPQEAVEDRLVVGSNSGNPFATGSIDGKQLDPCMGTGNRRDCTVVLVRKEAPSPAVGLLWARRTVALEAAGAVRIDPNTAAGMAAYRWYDVGHRHRSSSSVERCILGPRN